MLHRCLYHAAGLMQNARSRGSKPYDNTIVPITNGCGLSEIRRYMIGQAMLRMLSAIWQLVSKRTRSLTGHHKP